MRLLSAIIAILLLAGVGAACGPTKSGIVFFVDGKEFSDARIIFDGKSVGQFRSRTLAELRKEPRFVEDGQVTTADEDYFGVSDYISTSPGKHHIVFEATSKRRLEIEVNIEAGENYVSYSSSSRILRWNNYCFEAIPGKIVRVGLELALGPC